jgi:hypothetical protein
LIWFGFDLIGGVGTALGWVCDLRHCWSVGYLWSWQRLRMVGSRPELGCSCFGMPVVGIVRGRMWSIAGGSESTALYG